MSELDDILESYQLPKYDLTLPKTLPQAKGEIKNLMLRIIGEDDSMQPAIDSHSDAGAGHVIGSNALREQLRKKVAEL